MIYTEETKKRCIALRRKFGNQHYELGMVERQPYWIKFVNESNLSPFEKRACIKEFINPQDLETRYLKKYKKKEPK